MNLSAVLSRLAANDQSRAELSSKAIRMQPDSRGGVLLKGMRDATGHNGRPLLARHGAMLNMHTVLT